MTTTQTIAKYVPERLLVYIPSREQFFYVNRKHIDYGTEVVDEHLHAQVNLYAQVPGDSDHLNPVLSKCIELSLGHLESIHICTFTDDDCRLVQKKIAEEMLQVNAAEAHLMTVAEAK
ncbi:hypothetical protein [Persicobacter psychrovividus]|uniref:His-Xaa-Ser system protein HxsD n=1 Tax=Persicobacter psychrovividus TaxID=387638 RepID=A0ABM7VLI7_9BACT|nr:hypothetical protein PEPS_41300 [Persicobacter psychrovividus]